jgi:hypothetical protein
MTMSLTVSVKPSERRVGVFEVITEQSRDEGAGNGADVLELKLESPE